MNIVTFSEHFRIRNEHGVTLAEMLVVMGLLSVFLVILATIFTATSDIQNQSQAYSAVNAESRFIMSRLNFDIARATAIGTPATLGSSSASLVMTVSGSTYTYDLNSSRLRLTDNVGADFLTGNGVTVSALSFQRIGNAGGRESIRYSFTLTSAAQDHTGADVQTFTSTAERR